MSYRQIFIDGIWQQNTGLVVLLGLCPLLAVTGTVVNAIGLGLATLLTLACSNLSVSLLRRVLRPEIRIPAYVLIIASVGSHMPRRYRHYSVVHGRESDT